MELLSKMRALFQPKPVVVPPPPLFSDEEFLEFIAAQARRPREGQVAPAPRPAPPLGNAA